MKLSIITINYNNLPGLERTIESVLCQTYSNYEWIIIDGGSNDGSFDIIKKHSDRFSYWVSEPDSGVYQAQNKGIKKATGDYCYFLNSGDYLVDNKILEKIFKTDLHEDIIFGNLFVINKDKIIGRALGKEHLSFADIYANMVKHQASFIKRSLFERFGLFNEDKTIIADWEFFIKTIGLGNASYRYFDLFISYFDNNGISNHNEALIKKERELVIKENIPLMMRQDYEFLIKYKKYERLYLNSFSFFMIKLLNKILFK